MSQKVIDAIKAREDAKKPKRSARRTEVKADEKKDAKSG